MTDPTIDFAWFRFIGRTKLALSNKEVGRLTLREFNREYQYYKDSFDYELLLRLTNTTYAKAKAKAQEQEEWF